MARRSRVRSAATAPAPSFPAPRDPQDAPIPTQTKLVWFPAIVRVPGQEEFWRYAKVYAVPEGLYVYREVPADGHTPDWWAPVDYPSVLRPSTGVAARNGIVIPTESGPVSITKQSGCGCHLPLKSWVPEFSRRVVAW